ncbi:MAG: acylneuraminate cytidylyltransferase family protein [Daejeonella sp.]
MENILITLCARGGSKGIPGKNIKPIAGLPLIAYTINVANLFAKQHTAHIALSTDDLGIKAVAESLGLVTEYLRPEILAVDSAGKIDTIKDLVFYEEQIILTRYEYILDLDLTSPLRTLDDLNKAFIHFKDSKALTLFSVNPAGRNPYFNMVEKKENGLYGLVKTNPDSSVLTRQSAPPVYDLNASFYWYQRAFFDTDLKSPITQNSTIYEMPHICFDLDHPIDFDFLEYLLTTKKIDWLV